MRARPARAVEPGRPRPGPGPTGAERHLPADVNAMSAGLQLKAAEASWMMGLESS